MKPKMPDQKRLEMIADVARLYYEDKHKIDVIGKTFSISPSTVSRLLKEAERLGIVEVIIRYPFLTVSSLGKKLEQKYGLKNAYVLPAFQGTYYGLIEKIGQLAARVLEKELVDGMTLGISLGEAVASTAKAFAIPKKMKCRVVRLQGADENELGEGTDLAQIFSSQLGNEFRVIPSPWIMKSIEACEIIMQEKGVNDIIVEAESASIALFGIGAMGVSASTILRNDLLSIEEFDSLREEGAVGEICGKYFDHNGNLLDLDFNKRTVAINIEKLREIKVGIGVAAGSDKVDAIIGAIKGRFLNVLITDSTAAKLLLENK